jgi:hypothetical protein
MARVTTRARYRARRDASPQVPEVSATMHLYPIDGACHRVGADETAFAYRDATFATVIVAAWQDPAVGAERIAWVRDYYQATAPHSEAGGYVNFMADDDQGDLNQQIDPNGRVFLRPVSR